MNTLVNILSLEADLWLEAAVAVDMDEVCLGSSDFGG